MIPKSFTLVNRRWQVFDVTDNDMASDWDRHGDCDAAKAVIRIKLDNEENAEHTFLHELMHALFNMSTKPELSDNEELVDSMAAGLHQYLQTKKGKLIS